MERAQRSGLTVSVSRGESRVPPLAGGNVWLGAPPPSRRNRAFRSTSRRCCPFKASPRTKAPTPDSQTTSRPRSVDRPPAALPWPTGCGTRGSPGGGSGAEPGPGIEARRAGPPGTRATLRVVAPAAPQPRSPAAPQPRSPAAPQPRSPAAPQPVGVPAPAAVGRAVVRTVTGPGRGPSGGGRSGGGRSGGGRSGGGRSGAVAGGELPWTVGRGRHTLCGVDHACRGTCGPSGSPSRVALMRSPFAWSLPWSSALRVRGFRSPDPESFTVCRVSILCATSRCPRRVNNTVVGIKWGC